MSERERAAWALLCLADVREQIASEYAGRARERTGEIDHEALRIAMGVASAARLRLRDEFGLNLDTAFDDADDLYIELCEKVKQKMAEDDARERERDERLDQLQARVDELLKRTQ